MPNVSLSIGKRRMVAMKSYTTAIERQFPDPVTRLDKKSGSKQPDLNETYSSHDLIQPPFSMAVMTRLPELNDFLAGAIDAIATNASACDLELKWTGDGDENKNERDALNAFFFESNDPTNPMSLNEKIKACVLDFVTLGSWNLEIVESPGHVPADLVHAPAEFVRVKSGMAGYVMVKNSESVPFALYGDTSKKDHNQIVRAISKAPRHRVYGRPAIYSLVSTVLLTSLRDEKNIEWFEQGQPSDTLVLTEDTIEKSVQDQVIADYQNTADEAQSLYFLSGVGKSIIKHITRDLEGKSVSELETQARQRILSALRVPPAKVGIYEDANRANTITQDEVFQNEVIRPIQNTFKVRFDHIIRHLFGFKNWEFSVRPLSLKDRASEAKIDTMYADKGVFTVNEIRAKLNKPPVEGGDRRVVNTPLGLVDLDTWEIAVSGLDDPDTLERLGDREAIGLVYRLMDLRTRLRASGRDDESSPETAA